MKISKKFLGAAALAAIVSTSALVAPPAHAAVQVSHIVVDVNGEKVVVGTDEYGMIILQLGDEQLTKYLMNGGNSPIVSALNFGGKYVDIAEYGLNLLFSASADEALENTPPISSTGFKEVIEFDKSGFPILGEIDPEVEAFEVTGIE